ncbi:hypothetical protein C3E97_028090 [Pseudomonas sp. MWU12-2115]|uniref:hypothetical protein n=1 Tax=unclassified Pseudomonas TaxID=196821 RepID=UPI000CD566C1|nr:hypothetical protein [Pseudomonas sp. MWU12-2020]RBB97324.1 hypothetical protein C3E97_028090 [Pseudomonas sp. MWU12-2115]
MKNVIFALAALASLAGCDDQPEFLLLCNGTDAYGITFDGQFGPWVMTKSGPMIGDIRGKATGEPIPCAEAEQLLGVEAEAWKPEDKKS